MFIFSGSIIKLEYINCHCNIKKQLYMSYIFIDLFPAFIRRGDLPRIYKPALSFQVNLGVYCDEGRMSMSYVIKLVIKDCYLLMVLRVNS